jgi:hypothetical protein
MKFRSEVNILYIELRYHSYITVMYCTMYILYILILIRNKHDHIFTINDFLYILVHLYVLSTSYIRTVPPLANGFYRSLTHTETRRVK